MNPSPPFHAFNLPPNTASTTLPVSSWHGKPVCHSSQSFTLRKYRLATVRTNLLILSQRADDTNSDVPPRPSPETNGDVEQLQTSPEPSRSASIWLFVIENAVQLTILALAIAGSIHTRRRVLTRLLALLSLPQLALIANRVWNRIRSPAQPLLASPHTSVFVDSSVSDDEATTPATEPAPAQQPQRQEDRGGELLLAQSKLISATIKTAVAEEVDSLRYAIEQIEHTTEERQQARNLAIAEAIASLDESLRSLRRSVDTRNQVEKSAPFALVSELEIVKSRLKQAEQEKAELEVRLRAAEDNFAEAKRQGERARREAEEATGKELGLRTQLAVASGRLLRLEDLTERLDRAERKNDELQEQLLNGTREQEGLRQSAEDAERRVVRVENIAKILRDKIQELTGKSLPRYGQEAGDLVGDVKEKNDDQFWPHRLRGKDDLRSDSVVYEELLREEKRSRSPKWPRDPLGIDGGRRDTAQLDKLPDDGGFGVGATSSDQDTNETGSDNKLLSQEGSSDKIFSFSRGEFDRSGLQKGTAEKPSVEEAETATESSRSPVDSSDVLISPGDSSVLDSNAGSQEADATLLERSGLQKKSAEKPRVEEAKTSSESSKYPVDSSDVLISPVDSSALDTQTEDDRKDDVLQSRSPVEKPSTMSSTAVEELKDSTVSSTAVEELKDEILGGSRESDLEVESSDSPQYKSGDAVVVKSSSHVQAPEETKGDIRDLTPPENGVGLDKGSVIDSGGIPASSESVIEDIRVQSKQDEEPYDMEDKFEKEVETFQEPSIPDSSAPAVEEIPVRQKQDETPYDTEDGFAEKEVKTFQESVYSVATEAISGREAEPGNSVESDTAHAGDAESEQDQRTVLTQPIVSTESTSDSDHFGITSSTARDEQDSGYPSPEATTNEPTVGTVGTTSYLESLSKDEQSRPRETTEDQIRTARGLIKKARTRGLAVKQADLLFEKATEKLERALEQVDDHTEVEADLGECLLAWAKTNIANPLAPKRLSRALGLLTSSLESQPRNETVLFNTGLCLCLLASSGTKEKALEGYQKACDMYEKLLKVNVSSRIACFNCGLAYVSLGRLSLGDENDENVRGYFERAAALFQRSLELKPGDSKAISYLDDCRRQLKELEFL